MRVLTKLRKISKRYSSFGGIHFVIDEIRKQNIHGLIDAALGERKGKNAKYSFSDVITSWIYLNLCGAGCLDDSTKLRKHFNYSAIKIPSHDQIGRIFKSLITQSEILKGKESFNQVNENIKLNELLLSIAAKLRIFKPNTRYTLDMDATVIETEKFDSKTTYLHEKGYMPVVSMVDDMPVYIEARNGNSSPSYELITPLHKTIEILKQKDITVNRVRMDSASYQIKIFEYLDKRKIDFFIRVRNSEQLFDNVPAGGDVWKKCSLHDGKEEISEIKYVPGRSDKAYRVIFIRRKPTIKRGKNSFMNDDMIYKAIITNNYSMTAEEVVWFYDQRGRMERSFDELKNDFNWQRLPFSFLNQNLVFMLISAMAFMIFKYVLNKFSEKAEFVKSNFRLKKFIIEFVQVTAQWIKRNNDRILYLYTDREYNVLRE